MYSSAGLDEIHIDDVEVFAYHGVYPMEKENGQRFLVSAVLFADLGRAGRSDELARTVNYAEAAELICESVSKGRHNLIEKVASDVCDTLLITFPLVRKIEIAVKKPDAPSKLKSASFSVRLTRRWNRVYLGLGSNMGDREKYLKDAISAINQSDKCRIMKESSVIESKPYGGVATNDFLNMAVKLETIFTPYALLDFIHEIENAAHRERSVVWGNRTLDIDILLFEDFVIDDQELTIPHPDMGNRDFVLKPLAEIGGKYGS